MFKKAKPPEASVLFETSDGEKPVEAGFSGDISLLELALRENLPISHSCDGNASCGTCRVVVLNDIELPGRNDLEQDMADDRGFKSHERLACQVLAKAGLKIRIP
ncbi:MAG TPA: 2Fe-2S iron-sulfur cluster-binding protein [Bdellovibrionales bacterium]|nr:2Fe-2S iron-sulfur cluster-binding protein [Bdellovibrionales bacterium]